MLAIKEVAPRPVSVSPLRLLRSPAAAPPALLAPPPLPRPDEGLLIWYFGEGICAFERSPQGEALERAKLFSLHSGDCRGCGGSGFTMPRKLGTRLAAGGKMQLDRWDSTCLPCGGTGRVAVNPGGPEHANHPKPPKSMTQDEGRAYAAAEPPNEVTARPIMGESHYQPSYTPEAWEMTRYASVVRRLGRMSDQANQVFWLHWGDQGAQWSTTHALGRLFALYPLTKAGRKLIEKNRRESAESTGYDVLCAQYALQRIKPDHGRAAAFAAARNQAQALYLAAAAEWMAAEFRSRPRPDGFPLELETPEHWEAEYQARLSQRPIWEAAREREVAELLAAEAFADAAQLALDEAMAADPKAARRAIRVAAAVTRFARVAARPIRAFRT